MINSAVKESMSTNLYFSGTEFQSVLVGRENAQAFVLMKVGELRKHLLSSYLSS